MTTAYSNIFPGLKKKVTQMHNETSDMAKVGYTNSRHCPDLFYKPTHIAIMIGLVLIGLLLGYIMAFFSFNKCHLRKNLYRISRKLKRRADHTSRDESPAFAIDNDRYFYAMPPSSSIYGTPDTYLTEDERKRLGMGKVKKHVSVQTEQQSQPPKYENVVADGLYDYTMTYIVHQNIMSATLNSRRGAICNESKCKKSPMYERPKKTPPLKRHDDVTRFHETRFDTDDTDDCGYLDPKSINPKNSKSKHTVCQCSSDSESEKEEVNNELVEYAKSLRLKKMASKNENVEYIEPMEVIPPEPKSTRPKLLEPKSSKKQYSLKKKRKNNDGKSGYMLVELTPELWEILQSHTADKRAAKSNRKSPKTDVVGDETTCSSKTGVVGKKTIRSSKKGVVSEETICSSKTGVVDEETICSSKTGVVDEETICSSKTGMVNEETICSSKTIVVDEATICSSKTDVVGEEIICSSNTFVVRDETVCSSKTCSEDEGPYCKMSKVPSRGETSTDDGDMDYIDIIM